MGKYHVLRVPNRGEVYQIFEVSGERDLELLAEVYQLPLVDQFIRALELRDNVDKQQEEEAEARRVENLMTSHEYRRSSKKYICDCGKHVSDEIHFIPKRRHWYLADLDKTREEATQTARYVPVLCKCGATEANPIHLEVTDV